MIVLLWLLLFAAGVGWFIVLIGGQHNSSNRTKKVLFWSLLVVIAVADFFFFYDAMGVPVLREAIGIVIGIAGVAWFMDAVKNRHKRPFRFVIGMLVGVAMLLVVAGLSVFLTEPLVRWAFR